MLKDCQKYYDMQYKATYIIWKCKKAWPVLDVLSLNFGLIFMVFILYCALYYTIAAIWVIFLLIFVLQTWWVQRIHRNDIKGKVDNFLVKEMPWGDWTTREYDNAYVTRSEKLLQHVKQTKMQKDESLQE